MAVTPDRPATSTGVQPSIWPQQRTRPPVTAQVSLPPVLMAITPDRPCTSTGVELSSVVPLPSCPYWLSPQHQAPPPARAQLWPPPGLESKGWAEPPALIAVTPHRPATSTGPYQTAPMVGPWPTSPIWLLPQHRTRPSTSAQLWTRPALMAASGAGVAVTVGEGVGVAVALGDAVGEIAGDCVGGADGVGLLAGERAQARTVSPATIRPAVRASLFRVG